MGVGGQRHISAASPPEKRPIAHFTGSWTSAENLPLTGVRSPDRFRPVASRYTDRAVPAKG
jgi:hypothetical protein